VRCSYNYNKFVGSCYTEGNKIKSVSIYPDEISIDIPELVTSDWFKKNKNKHSMWTQHFVYFCYQKQLYNLYRHTPPSSENKKGNSLADKAWVTHWKEKGAHFNGKSGKDSIIPLLQLEDINNITDGSPSVMDFPPSSMLKRYDWGANLVRMVGHLDPAATTTPSAEDSQDLPPVVMSVAIGYSLEVFVTFIESLREHYFGDVWLLISKDLSSSDSNANAEKASNGHGDEMDSREDSESTKIRRYLKIHNIRYLDIDVGRSGAVTTGSGWQQINRDRFSFFSKVCDPDVYSLCLTTDFRDSIFQSNPLANIDRLQLPPQSSTDSVATSPSGILHVFEHNKDLNSSSWHYDQMKVPECNLYEKYATTVYGTKIINGGSIIGSPFAFQRIEEFMIDKWKRCNDQVTLNVLVRANIARDGTYANAKEYTMTKKVVVKVHRQGDGPLNVVGFGGVILKNKQGRLLNRNCIVTPAVHQYDRVVCPLEKHLS
jgi:hypothetical protein